MPTDKLLNDHLYSEITPNGLKGWARVPWEGAEMKLFTLAGINTGDGVTISSNDVLYLIKWLIREAGMVDAVLLWDWLEHDYIGVERPERIVPEQGDGPF